MTKDNNRFGKDESAAKTEPLPAGAGRIELGLEAFSAFLSAAPSTAI